VRAPRRPTCACLYASGSRSMALMNFSTTEIFCLSNSPGCCRHTADSVAGRALAGLPRLLRRRCGRAWSHACGCLGTAARCQHGGAARPAGRRSRAGVGLAPLRQLLQPGTLVRTALQGRRPGRGGGQGCQQSELLTWEQAVIGAGGASPRSGAPIARGHDVCLIGGRGGAARHRCWRSGSRQTASRGPTGQNSGVRVPVVVLRHLVIAPLMARRAAREPAVPTTP
jgi:hypothetical protein